jgi:putative NIF3 family GTP cyclohydrolase 1 type 2
MTHVSRRKFAALAACAAASPFAFERTPSTAQPIAARDLFDRIKKQLEAQIGAAWKAESIDGLKAGDPAAIVTGVATTALATLDVLRQAVKAGANVVVTSQPAFYSRADARTPPAGRGARGASSDTPRPADPVFAAKNALVDERKLVIFRLNEHWRLRQPDAFSQGLARAMRWTTYQSSSDPRQFDLPALTVQALIASIEKQLRIGGGLRAVGDPRTTVRRIGLLPGSTPIQASLNMLPNVDVILAGEVREWESVEYARDTVAAGGKKALILVGRVVSEEPGMSLCAEWLKTIAPEIPVQHIAAGDPYWRPA